MKSKVDILHLALITCMLIFSTSFAHADPAVRILPLGDSITHGGGGGFTGYRRELWFGLNAAGYSVDFVGSHTGFYAAVGQELQDFDLDHEGHAGWRADQIANNITNWLSGYDADIALIHLGTNDLYQNQSINSTLDELSTVILKLREDNPSIVILLAQIIPMRSPDTAAFNSAMADWVASQRNGTSPIILVDHYSNYDANTDNFDNWHPNQSGQTKMADHWFESIEYVLSSENLAPEVAAGEDFSVNQPGQTALLSGSVIDDSLPTTATLTSKWSKISGPGTVGFDDDTIPATYATFSESGTYVLRLTADDSEYAVSDEVTVQVGSVSSDGLIGHWPLDEASGTTAFDISSYANNGTVRNSGANPWTNGIIDGAIQFDGSNDDIYVADKVLFRPQSLTLASWINVDPSLSGWAWVAGEGDNYGLAVNRYGRDDLHFYFYNGSGWVSHTAFDLPIRDGQWHHVAASFDDASGDITLYLNGIRLSSKNVGGAISYQKGSGFHIGSMSGSRVFKGGLDDVRLYSQTLTDAEITDIGTNNQPPENSRPSVNAGNDIFSASAGDTVLLDGSVSDDGLPANAPLTIQWSKVSGPGTVDYDSRDAAQTYATFSESGTYVLRLIGDDSELSASDDVTVQIGIDTINGLIGHWPLDETTGTTAFDITSNANNGTLRNANGSLWTDGYVNGAIQLDGINDDISVADIDLFRPQSLTLASWIKVDPSLSGWAWVAGEGDNYGLAVNRYGRDDLHFYFYNGSGWVSHTAFDLPIRDGQWHHVAASFDDASGDITLYLNGIRLSSKNVGGAISYQKGSGFHIGSMSGSRVFKGSLDDVRLYSQMLTDAELASIAFSNTEPQNQAPVVGAGQSASIQLPTDTVEIISTISDDDLPEGSEIVYTWTQLDSLTPATISPVSFESGTLTTSFVFTTAGEYRFELAASDGEFTTRDELLITVLDEIAPPENTAPLVNAGADQSITFPQNTVSVTSSFSDDGLPQNSELVVDWQQVTGPGNVTFSNEVVNANSISIDFTFDEAGVYTLRLNVSDGEFTSSDDISVTVADPGTTTGGPSLDGVAGFWRLDEGSGLLAQDSSESEAHGTLIGLDDSHWQQGIYGDALCMDGTTPQEVQVPSVSDLLKPASVTVAAWVKTDQSYSNWAWVAGQGDNYGLVVNRFGRDGVLFYYYNGRSWNSAGFENTNVRDGQWHHIAGSYDHLTGDLSVYLDGVLLNNRVYNQAISYAIGSDFSIGSMQGSRNFNGCLDEVQLYPRALSEASVAELAAYPTTVDPENTAPTINVVADRSSVLTGESVSLTITTEDDGLPGLQGHDLTIEQVEGPTPATIGPIIGEFPGTATADIQLLTAGNYVFSVTADDGELQSAQTLQILVEDLAPVRGPSLPGVTGLWHLDEGTGLLTYDTSLQNDAAQLIGLNESAWQDGVFNSSVCLDGTRNNHLTVDAPSAGLQSDSVSIAAWVKVNPNLRTYAWVAAHGDNYGLVVNRFNNDDLLFYIFNGVSWKSAGINYVGLLDGQWHHIAGAYDHTDRSISVFMDGVLLKNKPVYDLLTYGRGNSFTIGSMQGQRVFDGCIDELQVYDRALNESEVLQLTQ